MSSETQAGELHSSPEVLRHAENPSSKATPDSGAYRLIPLAQLDEPQDATRDTMDEIQLAELAESIQAHGLIQPLVVEQHGERYEVVAGHRRLLACQLVEYDPVPCLIRDPFLVDSSAVTLAENYYREQINPAEEAVFLDRLLTERCHGDVDTLAALIRRRRQYVEDRLLLKRGDSNVFQALANRDIPLGVARELNRVKDEGQRLLYLDSAIRGGATAAVVQRWRTQGEAAVPYDAETSAIARTAAAQPGAQPAEQMTCLFCGDADESHLMEVQYLHRQCKKFLVRILDRSQAPAEPQG